MARTRSEEKGVKSTNGGPAKKIKAPKAKPIIVPLVSALEPKLSLNPKNPPPAKKKTKATPIPVEPPPLAVEHEETLQEEYDGEEAMLTDFMQDKQTRSSTLETSGSGANGSSSSIPELSIAKIRAVLSEQRKLYQENNYINLTDNVLPSMSRYAFNFRYVHGIARKRFAKHQRASNKKTEEE